MATKLYLHAASDNTLDATYHDMTATAGSSAVELYTNTAAGPAEIQLQENGPPNYAWISGRVPAGGFTLAGTMTFSLWAFENSLSNNCGLRFRVYKYAYGGAITEITGSPFDKGSELTTSFTEELWTGSPTSTAFGEDDRILIVPYIVDAGGTMTGASFMGVKIDAADASEGDSFFQITETVAFKAEGDPDGTHGGGGTFSKIVGQGFSLAGPGGGLAA